MPTQILHGDDDQIVPIAASAGLGDAREGFDLKGVTGALQRHVHGQQGSDKRGSVGLY